MRLWTFLGCGLAAEHFPVRRSGQPVSVAGNPFPSFIWAGQIPGRFLQSLACREGQASRAGAQRKRLGSRHTPQGALRAVLLAEWPVALSQLPHADGGSWRLHGRELVLLRFNLLSTDPPVLASFYFPSRRKSSSAFGFFMITTG